MRSAGLPPGQLRRISAWGLAAPLFVAVSLLASFAAAQGMSQRSIQPPGTMRKPDAPRVGPQDYVLQHNDNSPLVAEIRIVGNGGTPESRVRSYLKTRAGRNLDTELVQADVRRLLASGLFRDVRTYQQESPNGVIVTFEVLERPTIRYIKYVGNYRVKENALEKRAELKVGQSMNLHAVDEARRKVEEYYRSNGYPRAEVSVLEGNKPSDQGVVFMIHEGNREMVWETNFEGNTIATDDRLMTLIESKPSYFSALGFGGRVDRQKIDDDVKKLVDYYRGLGYFKARISRVLEYSDSGWLTLNFIIDEGPRYRVREIRFNGNERMADDKLLTEMQMRQGDFFNLDILNADVAAVKDIYGGNGFAFADVQAEPRFLEEPGQIDLVMRVEEGDVYRIGKINVKIDGEFPHTRHSVVMPRLSFAPGDIIDVRKIRDSERRLKSSQLFENNVATGTSPQIVIHPPNLRDIEAREIAERSGTPEAPQFRGQSPDADSGMSVEVHRASPPVGEWSGYGTPPNPFEHLGRAPADPPANAVSTYDVAPAGYSAPAAAPVAPRYPALPASPTLRGAP